MFLEEGKKIHQVKNMFCISDDAFDLLGYRLGIIKEYCFVILFLKVNFWAVSL